MAKLKYKLEITGTITVKTGLHIGGSDVDLTIGGIDSEVAKNKDGSPYIPGSSLGGKLRNLIAKAKGYKFLNFNAAKQSNEIDLKNWDRSFTALLFSGRGFNADFRKDSNNKKHDNSNNSITVNGLSVELSPYTRLLIRDSFLSKEFNEKILEDKAENTIDRNTGVANPRHIERVVRGTDFDLNMTLDIYDKDDVIGLCETLALGINLLNNDYLGGMGSRGSGSVEIRIDNVVELSFENGIINRKPFTTYLFN